MRKITKNLIAATSAIILSFNLTACDPPMPPDVAAGILEQTYTCEEGTVTVSFPENMSDPAFQLADALSTSCTDPLATMLIEQQQDGLQADIVISDYAPDAAICSPAFVVPFATEAADIVFQLVDSSTLNLSPKTLAAILNGEITNWNDEAIAKENVETIFPDLAIKVNKQADQLALEAMTNWLSIQNQDISGAGIKPVRKLAFPVLAEGEIAIAPHSQVVAAGYYAASIITGSNSDTGEQLLAVADTVGIPAGATQFTVEKDGNFISLKLDPSIPVIAQAGLDEPAPPYQAIYPINLYACGEDNLLKHAVALFLLRLDSQGVLAASNYNALAETVRFESLAVARKGLPTPELVEPIAE